MLKHMYHSVSSIKRGVSPAPSSSSALTDDFTSSSSQRSIHSSSSSTTSDQSEILSTSSFSWRALSECRTSSRLSMSDNPNSVPLRIYATELRPDIQYKTVGVTHSTTCEEVIGALLAKCRVRFKDPRLFHLKMEVDIRGPNGLDTRASIQLEDCAFPLQLQECYPKGQARFCLQMERGTLVKIFDGSNTVGWQYKSILISEKTTAGELIDILFCYVAKSLFDTKYYTLHIEVDAWKRQLEWNESVIPAQNVASQWGTPKLILGCLDHRHSVSLLHGNSTTSLYDNIPTQSQAHDSSLNSSGHSSTSTSSSESIRRRDWRRGRWRRSKSLSDGPSNILSTFSESVQKPCSNSTLKLQVVEDHNNDHSVTDSILAGFARRNTRFGKYEFSEAFFV